jgi:monoamine oxidase
VTGCFTEEMIKAIDNGIPATFTFFVGLYRIRPFWRDKEVSPSGQGYHYNHNAETYMNVGEAMGKAMVELLGGSK